MADDDISVADSAGDPKKVDTRTVGDDEHRQVVVVGDPSSTDVAEPDGSGYHLPTSLPSVTFEATSASDANYFDEFFRFDAADYGWVSVQVLDIGTYDFGSGEDAQYGFVAFETSNDGDNWLALSLHDDNGNYRATVAWDYSTQGLFAGTLTGRYFRLRGARNASAVVVFRPTAPHAEASRYDGTGNLRVVASFDPNGILQVTGIGLGPVGVNGSTLADYATDGVPVVIGARANNYPGPTPVSDDGDTVQLWANKKGALKVNLVTDTGQPIGDDNYGYLYTTLYSQDGFNPFDEDIGALKVRTTGYWETWSTTADNSDTPLTNTVVEITGAYGGRALGGYVIHNPNSGVAYVQFFNLHDEDVTLGTDKPKMIVPIAGQSVAQIEFTNCVAFNVGLSIAATTTASGSTAPATGLDVTILHRNYYP